MGRETEQPGLVRLSNSMPRAGRTSAGGVGADRERALMEMGIATTSRGNVVADANLDPQAASGEFRVRTLPDSGPPNPRTQVVLPRAGLSREIGHAARTVNRQDSGWELPNSHIGSDLGNGEFGQLRTPVNAVPLAWSRPAEVGSAMLARGDLLFGHVPGDQEKACCVDCSRCRLSNT